MRLWTPAFVAIGVMLACALRAFTWHLDSSHFTPHGERLYFAMFAAIPVCPGVALLWAAITRRLATRLTVTLISLSVLTAAAGVATIYFTTPLFGPHWGASSISPDGTREAHLEISGLLGCSVSLYTSERRGLRAELIEGHEVECDTERIIWLEDGGVTFDGGIAKPLNLFFGPH